MIIWEIVVILVKFNIFWFAKIFRIHGQILILSGILMSHDEFYFANYDCSS
jgi:hypothetical protein